MAEAHICSPDTLQRFAERIIRGMGADAEVAAEVARHLVRSNLSGHDSHGVLRIPQYATQMDRGELVPAARPAILHETASTALVDARRGFGHFSTAFALDWAMARARQNGLAGATVRHSSHIGRLGEYTERAGEQGLIAILTVGAAGPGVGGMVLYGGRRRFFGANPWSIGIPTQGRAPVVFDGSTSTVAEGKVRFARAKGVSLPPDCIIDNQGRPSTDPADLYAGGALVPLGGQVAGHKGYGLAMASALLGALCMIDDPEPTLIGASVVDGDSDRRGIVAGVYLIAIDPAVYGDAERYRTLVSENVAAAKRMPTAEGIAEILVPGEPEARTRAQREQEGIVIPQVNWADLAQVAERFGVPMPETRPA